MPSPLKALILSPHVAIGEIATFLDDASPQERRREVLSLGWRHQRALYAKAVASAPLTLEYFVPDNVEHLTEVVHLGRNGLPKVPGVPEYKNFEKRFCRPSDQDGVLYGFNEAPIRSTIGPGYFVARQSGLGVAKRGAVVIDYTRVPETEVVKTWPEVVPNEVGLQRFVFKGTSDFMRRVSEHVSVGAAYKGDTALRAYFVLCRQDATVVKPGEH